VVRHIEAMAFTQIIDAMVFTTTIDAMLEDV
jgi:hypothetical protein